MSVSEAPFHSGVGIEGKDSGVTDGLLALLGRGLVQAESVGPGPTQWFWGKCARCGSPAAALPPPAVWRQTRRGSSGAARGGAPPPLRGPRPGLGAQPPFAGSDPTAPGPPFTVGPASGCV